MRVLAQIYFFGSKLQAREDLDFHLGEVAVCVYFYGIRYASGEVRRNILFSENLSSVHQHDYDVVRKAFLQLHVQKHSTEAP